MLRFAAKSLRPTPAARRLSSVAATDTNLGSHKENPFKKHEYYFRGLWQPVIHNPACDMFEDYVWNSLKGSVYKYVPVMIQALYYEGERSSVGTDLHAPSDVRDGIKMAVETVRKYLLEYSPRMVTSSEEIIQVATVAANGDRKIGELVAKAIEKVGHNTDAFVLSDKKKSKNELEFENGMSLKWGLISPFFLTNKKSGTCVLQHPFILMHENKISEEVIGRATFVVENKLNARPFLFITKDIETEEVGSLTLDWYYRGLKLCVVKSPKYEEDMKAILQDLAILTGGQAHSVIDDDTCREFLAQSMGSCKEFRATRDEMFIIGGSGSQAAIEERCEQLRSAIKLSSSENEIKSLETRLAKLSRGVAVFKVGGDGKEGVHKKNKRIRNAIEAAKAAIEGGVVPGCGVALLNASKELDKLDVKDPEVKLGIQFIQHVLKIPVYSIASTAGFDGVATVEKLLEEDNPNVGFDPVTGEYVDMIKAGNVDPYKLLINEFDRLTFRVTGRDPFC